MRTFILLSTLTHQGMETLAVTPERLFEVNREIEALGGRVVDQWALLGSVGWEDWSDFDELSGSVPSNLSSASSARPRSLVTRIARTQSKPSSTSSGAAVTICL